MIEVSQLSKVYRSHNQNIKVLDRVDLKIGRGECVGLKGPSGSGKTTLLNIIGGMLVPTSGTVKVNGLSLTALPQSFLSRFRRETVSFVFQQFNLIEKFTVLENVLFPLIPSGKPMKEIREKAMGLLERLKIKHRLNFEVNELSGGEQQRVAVARALVTEPQLIIADEPFSNLDLKNTKIILEIFRELKAEKKTIIMTSHYENFDLTDSMMDREVYLDDYQ